MRFRHVMLIAYPTEGDGARYRTEAAGGVTYDIPPREGHVSFGFSPFCVSAAPDRGLTSRQAQSTCLLIIAPS